MEISREDEEITKRHLTYLQLKLENLKEPLKKKLAGNIKNYSKSFYAYERSKQKV